MTDSAANAFDSPGSAPGGMLTVGAVNDPAPGANRVHHITTVSDRHMATNAFDSFTLTPLSAGDIIDRAVRLYRRNFLPLLRIVILPSLVAYLGSVLYYIGIRNFSLSRGDERVAWTVFLIVGGGGLWLFGKAAFYLVLGGAARSLVDHFFEAKPILARDVYRAVRQRFWSLIGALAMIILLLMGLFMLVYFITAMAILLYALIAAVVLNVLPAWLQTTLTVISVVLLLIGLALLSLLVYSRMVYVPQVMMVEGKGVLSSISRSFSLAGGEVRRLAALVLFWFYVAWSVGWLLFAPLGWYGYWSGVEFLNPFNQSIPLWFTITQQTLTQVSEILLMPIAMLGFTLLYLDSRVRKEGFDIELLANRVLAPPQMPHFQPAAVAAVPYTQPEEPYLSTLGLSDYTPTAVPQAARATEAAVAPVTEFVPAEPAAPPIIAANDPLPETVSPVMAQPAPPSDPKPRACPWCETPAGVEDRFCRVCGSVF